MIIMNVIRDERPVYWAGQTPETSFPTCTIVTLPFPETPPPPMEPEPDRHRETTISLLAGLTLTGLTGGAPFCNQPKLPGWEGGLRFAPSDYWVPPTDVINPGKPVATVRPNVTMF
jgi:hypothetical protein